MRESIEEALAPLVGLPVWTIGRAGNLVWLHFGASREQVVSLGTRAGTVKQVGDYALHVACPWRLAQNNRIVVAGGDFYVPASDDLDESEWNWDMPGANRCDAVATELRGAWAATPERVVSVTAEVLGGLRIALTHDYVFEAFPCTSSPNDDVAEYWRLFQPGGPAHIVVTSGGLDRESDAMMPNKSLQQASGLWKRRLRRRILLNPLAAETGRYAHQQPSV